MTFFVKRNTKQSFTKNVTFSDMKYRKCKTMTKTAHIFTGDCLKNHGEFYKNLAVA